MMQYIAAVTGSGAVVDRVKKHDFRVESVCWSRSEMQKRFATTTRADLGSTLRFNSIFEEI